MKTDISRRIQLEKDAQYLEEAASTLRSFADEDLTKLRDWERRDKLTELRVKIKYSIEVLINNLPV